MQRLRITFTRGDMVKYISHLDMMRLWERAFRRGGVDLAYSQGFSPHPRISIAAPLPIGVTSETELMDVWLQKKISPYYFPKLVAEQIPAGVVISRVEQVAVNAPSLQSQVREAEYRLELRTEQGLGEIQDAISGFVEKEHVPWQHQRDTGVRYYDIRSLVRRLWLDRCQGDWCTIGMILRTDSTATGRPEQVAAALGFKDRLVSVHRTRLILAGS